MSDDDPGTRHEGSRRWLLEPLAPDEVRIHVEAGESVEMSDELRSALDALLTELYASEVEGFALPPGGSCDPWYECFLRKCQPHVVTTGCFVDSSCHITRLV